MAYLPDDEKLKKPPGEEEQPGVTASGAETGGVNPGGQFAATGGPQSAPAGTGGSPGWTNIQDYLTANKGMTGTADYLKQQVGSQFANEQKSLGEQAADTKQKAASEVDKTRFNQDDASKRIQDASKQYSYQGAPTSQYSDVVNDYRTKLNAKYQGPTQFAYGFQAPTQEYGSNLGNDQGFSAIMNSLYDKASGSTMGTGARALQTQLDTNNQAVNQSRQDLTKQYQDLASARDKELTDTQGAIGQSQKDFTDYQGQLKNYLTGQQSNAKSAIDQKVNATNSLINLFGKGLTDYFNEAGAPANYRTDPGLKNIYTGRTGDSFNESNVSAPEQQGQFNTIADIFGAAPIMVNAPKKLTDINWDLQGVNQSTHGNSSKSINLGKYLSDYISGGAGFDGQDADYYGQIAAGERNGMGTPSGPLLSGRFPVDLKSIYDQAIQLGLMAPAESVSDKFKPRTGGPQTRPRG
jgi:hypothetical protein